MGSVFEELNDLALVIHAANQKKGFYDAEKNIGEMLALIHSEVSEALECDRKNQVAKLSSEQLTLLQNQADPNSFKLHFEETVKDTFADELADILIRVLDLAAFKNIPIGQHIQLKLKYNALRPYKHGKRY